MVEQVIDQPYAVAERACEQAMHHTISKSSRTGYHQQGVTLHSLALKLLAKALEQARQSNDIAAEKKYKSLFVHHQNIRDAHDFVINGHEDEDL